MSPRNSSRACRNPSSSIAQWRRRSMRRTVRCSRPRSMRERKNCTMPYPNRKANSGKLRPSTPRPITTWITVSRALRAGTWTPNAPACWPHRNQGTFAIAIRASIRPRARSGARERGGRACASVQPARRKGGAGTGSVVLTMVDLLGSWGCGVNVAEPRPARTRQRSPFRARWWRVPPWGTGCRGPFRHRLCLDWQASEPDP